MEVWIKNYVRTADTYQRNNTLQHAKFGTLKPLLILYAPFMDISMDFITDLPEVWGYNKIWVIVDLFSKLAHFIPFKKITARELATTFLRDYWQHHSLPKRIVSDQDTLFTSQFWEALMKLLDVHTDKFIAFHPQTDGQTEIVNQILEFYLRSYCNWD